MVLPEGVEPMRYATMNDLAKLRADVVAALRWGGNEFALDWEMRAGRPVPVRGATLRAAEKLSSPPPPKVELPEGLNEMFRGLAVVGIPIHGSIYGDRLMALAKLIRDGKAEVVLKEVK